MPQNPFISELADICWPALVAPRAAGLLALMFQFEQTQYWPESERSLHQFQQLAKVLEHAERTVPFYRTRFGELNASARELAELSAWQRLPLLSRREVQLAGSQLHSTQVPAGHGRVSATSTSGSTNQPVTTLGTEVTQLFWQAITLRDHLWHRRDFRQSLAAIRHTGDDQAMPPQGVRNDTWGAATRNVFRTGVSHTLNVRSTVDEQIAWLLEISPSYLLSYPSVLRAIAEQFERRSLRLPSLCEVRAFGEVLETETRTICERVFGVPVVDLYSTQEVGYIALQCPVSGHYHLQSESLLVEILDDAGLPCAPGAVGKVVVTTLHNFAMPLLRYDIGDYAQVGTACPCGRQLPVITRILGRQRGLIVMPDGARRWPVFDAGERPEELPPFFQYQVIQKSRSQVEVLVVRHAPLQAGEIRKIQRYMQQTLGAPFDVAIREVETIPRSPSGKFEDFICEIT